LIDGLEFPEDDIEIDADLSDSDGYLSEVCLFILYTGLLLLPTKAYGLPPFTLFSLFQLQQRQSFHCLVNLLQRVYACQCVISGLLLAFITGCLIHNMQDPGCPYYSDSEDGDDVKG
jgi:hypothetical protein